MDVIIESNLNYFIEKYLLHIVQCTRKHTIGLFLQSTYVKMSTIKLLFDSVYIQYISKNPNLDLEILKEIDTGDCSLWDWTNISEYNSNIMYYFNHDVFKRYVLKKRTSANKSLTSAFISENKRRLNFTVLSRNLSVPLDFINSTSNDPSYCWNWCNISSRSDLTFDFIRSNLHKPLEWYAITSSNKFSFEDIVKADALGWPWFWVVISEYAKVTAEILKEMTEIPWSFQIMSKNPNLTPEIMIAFPDKDWNLWLIESERNDIHIFINKLPHLKWNLHKFKDNMNSDWKMLHTCRYAHNRSFKDIHLIESNLSTKTKQTVPISKRCSKTTWMHISDYVNLTDFWSTETYDSTFTTKLVEKYPSKTWNWGTVLMIKADELRKQYIYINDLFKQDLLKYNLSPKRVYLFLNKYSYSTGTEEYSI